MAIRVWLQWLDAMSLQTSSILILRTHNYITLYIIYIMRIS